MCTLVSLPLSLGWGLWDMGTSGWKEAQNERKYHPEARHSHTEMPWKGRVKSWLVKPLERWDMFIKQIPLY